jgi:tRNA G37 N-methylase TrmD
MIILEALLVLFLGYLGLVVLSAGFSVVMILIDAVSRTLIGVLNKKKEIGTK